MGLAIWAVICALWRVPDDVDIMDAAKWLRAFGIGAVFTLWIVWHGWFARTSNIYLGELIFRIFNTVLLFTVFRWVFTLNVSPANTFMPLAVSVSIVFKEAVNGLLNIFIAQGLLYSDTVMAFFKLPKRHCRPPHVHLYKRGYSWWNLNI